VLGRDEAVRRFAAALDLSPLPPETVPLSGSLGRVLAADVASRVDAPPFDRSGVDGFAVRAADGVRRRGGARPSASGSTRR
jgi:putative molybdopterin biosynthesis protein